MDPADATGRGTPSPPGMQFAHPRAEGDNGTAMERVIVTGGTGFIGRALCRRLAERGYEVVVLSREPSRHSIPDARLVEWDGRTVSGWGELADGAYAIVNLAGANIAGRRWNEHYKQTLRESRLDAGRAAVEAVREAKRRPKVLLQASAVGYYGPRGDEVLTEDSPPGDDFLARLAVDWEGSTAAVEGLGLRRVVLRIGAVLERDGGMLARLLPAFRFFLGGPLGSGRQWLSIIHRADLVEALILLMEDEEAAGPFNLTAPEPVRMRDFARELGRALKRPAWLPLPRPLLWLALGEGAEFVVQGQRVVPKRLQRLGYTFRYPTVEAALQAIFR